MANYTTSKFVSGGTTAEFIDYQGPLEPKLTPNYREIKQSGTAGKTLKKLDETPGEYQARS